MSDSLLRFIFDETDVRGELVQLDSSYRDALTPHHYPPPVALLLGEFLAASALLSATLKFEGSLILQARSPGEVPLIMAEATSAGAVRGIARQAEQALSEDFQSLLGGGQLAITIDPASGQRYQGIVPLEGVDLASGIERYFEQSEQLGTRLWLAADGRRAAGLLLQELPSRQGVDPERRQAQWQHLTTLGATVQADELLNLAPERVLHRLFHQDPLRLLRCDSLHFACSCSRARTEAVLTRLGRTELESILLEQGGVNVTCEFCNQVYEFSADDLRGLIGAGPSATTH